MTKKKQTKKRIQPELWVDTELPPDTAMIIHPESIDIEYSADEKGSRITIRGAERIVAQNLSLLNFF